ncbi:hypothetical protein CONPUDRAFT_81466, partial [Coniophora puteana RWD-64-598 SS2]
LACLALAVLVPGTEIWEGELKNIDQDLRRETQERGDKSQMVDVGVEEYDPGAVQRYEGCIHPVQSSRQVGDNPTNFASQLRRNTMSGVCESFEPSIRQSLVKR